MVAKTFAALMMVAAATLLAGSAHAETTGTDAPVAKAKKRAKKGSKTPKNAKENALPAKAMAAQAAPAPAEVIAPVTAGGPAETAVPMRATASPDSSTTTTLSAVVPTTKKRWGASLTNWHDFNKSSVNNRKPSVSATTRVGGSYKFSDTGSVGYTQEFGYKYATGEGESRKDGVGRVNDGFFQVLSSKIATFGPEITLSGFGRLYVPTGETSRFLTKRNGALLVSGSLGKSFGKLDLSYNALGITFSQTKGTFVNREGEIEPTDDFYYEHYIGADYNVSSKVVAYGTFGFEDSFYREKNKDGNQRDTVLATEIGMNFKPTDQLTVSAAVINGAPIESNNAVNYFSDDNTKYRALLSLSL